MGGPLRNRGHSRRARDAAKVTDESGGASVMRKTMLAAALAGGCLGLAAECHTPTATAAGPTCTARFVTAKHSAFNKQPCEKPCSGGVFHFYGNQKAMQGFNSGKFEDGSIIADEVLETWGEGVSAKEGPRRVVGVMVKDSRKYADTGGW